MEFFIKLFQEQKPPDLTTLNEKSANYRRWLEEFSKNAEDQLKNLTVEPWRPKTPKLNVKVRSCITRQSRQKSADSDFTSSRLESAKTKATRSNTKESKRKSSVKLEVLDQSTGASEEEDKKAMPPPPKVSHPKRPKKAAELSDTEQPVRKSKRVATAKFKVSNASGTNTRMSRASSTCLFLESVSTDEEYVPNASRSAAKDVTGEGNPANREVDCVKVLSDEPDSSDSGDARRTRMIQGTNKGTLIKVETPDLVFDLSSESDKEKLNSDKEKLKKAKIILNRLDTAVVAGSSNSDREKENATPVLRVSEEKGSTPKLNKDTDSKKNKPEVAINSENSSTPRLPIFQDAKKSLHKSLLNCAKTPQSPKQLFSAYTKGDIKDKALAFEKMSNSNPSTPHNVATALTTNKERRVSVLKQSTAGNVELLEKASRMSLSKRRSSLMRFRLSAVLNLNKSLNKKLSSDMEKKRSFSKENRLSQIVDDTSGTEETEGETSTEPVKDYGKCNESVTATEKIKDSQTPIQEDSIGEDSNITPKVVAEEDQNILVKSASSTESFKKPVAITSLQKTPSAKQQNKFPAAKSNLNGTAPKRHYPASESKMNRVAELVTVFDKQATSSSNSCSKAQAFRSCKDNNTSSTLYSVLNGFKNFQKSNQATHFSTSKTVLIEKKRAKEEEAARKRQKLLQEKMEESKRKNEEKQQRVKENRLKEKERVSENIRRTLENRDKEKKKSLLEAKRKLRLKRELELEKRREEELRLLRLKKQEEQKQREIAELKKQQQQRAQEAISAVSKAKPVATLNQTYVADQSSEVNSYDITPHRSELPKEELKDSNNYDIEDLKSGDETDDENDPRKKIPNWAQGVSLRIAIIHQHRNPPNLDELFPPIQTCSLEKIFKHHRSRFQVRTSSAVWHDPPLL